MTKNSSGFNLESWEDKNSKIQFWWLVCAKQPLSSALHYTGKYIPLSGIQDTSFSTYYNLCLHTVIELQLVRKNLKIGEDNPKNLKHVH